MQENTIRRADRPPSVLDNQNKFVVTGKPVGGPKSKFRHLSRFSHIEAARGARSPPDHRQITGRSATSMDLLFLAVFLLLFCSFWLLLAAFSCCFFCSFWLCFSCFRLSPLADPRSTRGGRRQWRSLQIQFKYYFN